MTLQEWLDKVAVRETLELDDPRNVSFEDKREVYDIYVSKFDSSYITPCVLVEQTGNDALFEFLAEHEVTEQLTHGVGFSPKEQKWYGWSHRAIFGFGIGSTCKKSDCHYHPANPEDFLESVLRFWEDPSKKNVQGAHTVEGKTKGVYVQWEPRNKGDITGVFEPYPVFWGKGEWTAQTLEDAKQMAIDFNEGVS